MVTVQRDTTRIYRIDYQLKTCIILHTSKAKVYTFHPSCNHGAGLAKVPHELQ